MPTILSSTSSPSLPRWGDDWRTTHGVKGCPVPDHDQVPGPQPLRTTPDIEEAIHVLFGLERSLVVPRTKTQKSGSGRTSERRIVEDN